jgi:hypothetical protein
MVFLLLIDAVASASLYLVFRCGTWVLYSSASGLYYIYKKFKPTENYDIISNTDKTKNQEHSQGNESEVGEGKGEYDGDDDNDCVILTRIEYDKLIELTTS